MPGKRTSKPREKVAKRGREVIDDLSLLLNVLPARVREKLETETDLDGLLEIVMDLGREADARFYGKDVRLEGLEVTREDLDYVVRRVGVFTGDNRAGIERTLHRISAMRNRRQEIVGLTCRVGRAVTGTVDIIRDVVETGHSLLLLGPPGVGKTTLLREAARVLAEHLGKRVVVVDTSNEIAGDGDVPHPGIGRARRMQVPSPDLQHKVMIEAVENHMPEVIVIDEIGTMAEALAARTIAERGVQLVATAHGVTLDNLIVNPTLSDLIGGIQVVTLSDEEARRRGTRKSVLERKSPPTFDILVQIQTRDRLAVYHDVSRVVDRYLTGSPLRPEVRVRAADGRVNVETHGDWERPPEVRHEELEEASALKRRAGVWEREQAGAGTEHAGQSAGRKSVTRIYPLGVSRIRLDKALRELGVPGKLVDQPVHADLVLSLKAQRKRQPKKLGEALADGVELRTIKSNTASQIRGFLTDYFEPWIRQEPGYSETAAASLQEAEDAVVRVQRLMAPVELAPQNSYIRRLQHELVYSHGLQSESKGKPPYRRVVVYPKDA